MKTCDYKDCNYPVFSHGRCKYHQYTLHMKGGALYAPKKRSKTLSPLHKNKHPPIAKESPKRKKEHVYYTQICKEKETELRALDPQGRIFDFFSGHEILEKVTWHHPYGRTGDNYTDKEHMQPVIGKFHLMFHKQTVEKLEQQEWYADFLTRYKAFDENLWTKQTEKKLKNINPKLFNFDEDNQ